MQPVMLVEVWVGVVRPGLRTSMHAAGVQDVVQESGSKLRNTLWSAALCRGLSKLELPGREMRHLQDGLQHPHLHNAVQRGLSQSLRETFLQLEVQEPGSLSETGLPLAVLGHEDVRRGRYG